MNPNQPAFPSSGSDNPKLMGLTKREYFIAIAMQGILSTVEGVSAAAKAGSVTSVAVSFADDLIRDLNK